MNTFSTLEFPVVCVPVCTSTQDEARQWIEKSDYKGKIFAILSNQQTQGRGRGGSTWVQAQVSDLSSYSSEVSAFGSLSACLKKQMDFLPMTLVVPAPLLAIDVSWLPSAVGCALLDALRTTVSFLLSTFHDLPTAAGWSDESLLIKWPNDVLVENLLFQKDESTKEAKDDSLALKKYFKIAGILCETSTQGQGFSHFSIGIGLNLFAKPEGVEQGTSWFHALFARSSEKKNERSKLNKFLAQQSNRAAILERFGSAFSRELLEYLTVPRAPEQLRGLTLERSVPRGTLLSVNKGASVGRFLGLTESGALLLEGQSQPLLAGDVAIYEGLSSLQRPKSTDASAPNVPVPKVLFVTLECGNTHIHWELSLDDKSVAQGEFTWDEFATPESLRRPSEKIRALVMAMVPFKKEKIGIGFTSVSESARTRKFVHDLETLLRNVFPEVKLSRKEVTSAALFQSAGLASQYDTSTLGADRALRFLFCEKKAKQLGKPVATVGAGTAFTLECVDAQGQFLESLIAPGWQMGLEALHEKTARLPELSPELRAKPEGRPWTTEDSMQRGVLLPFVSILHAFVHKHHLAKVYLSGGSAAALAEEFSNQFPLEAVHLEVSLDLERSVLRQFLQKEDLHKDTPFKPHKEKPAMAQASVSPASASVSADLRPVSAVPLDEEDLDEEVYAPLSTPAADVRRAPPEAMLRSMLKARMKKAEDLRLEPRREDFRKLGVRIENITEDGERLDKWLSEKYKFHNRDTWQQRVEAGEVLVQRGAPKIIDHEPPAEGLHRVKHTYRLRNRDQIWLFHPPEYEPDHIDTCEVDFDDGDTMVFNKPGNLVIHASGLYGRNTFLEVAKRMGHADAAPVHRLDRETSGALVCARSQAQRQALSLAFRNGRMKKMYLAITRSVSQAAAVDALKDPNLEKPKCFRASFPIGPAIDSKIRLKLWVDHPQAQEALTSFVRLSSWNGFHLYACFPHTGRTNQIRIHLRACGEWIVGDKMYHPDETVFLKFYEEGLTPWVQEQVLFPRHLLHNTGIEALDTGEPGVAKPKGGIWGKAVVCPFPEDMMSFEPVLKLLEEAGLPSTKPQQMAAFGALFERYAHNESAFLESCRGYP
jgi:pantothenate kinase type III